jgi:hypothetical protein
MNLETLKHDIPKYIYTSTKKTTYNNKNKESLAESALFILKVLESVNNTSVIIKLDDTEKELYISIDNILYSAGHMLIYADYNIRRYLADFLLDSNKKDSELIKRDIRITGDGWNKALVIIFDSLRYK